MKGYKYACTNCDYTFKRDVPFEDSKCPYCGKTGVYQDKQHMAQDLLNSVD